MTALLGIVIVLGLGYAALTALTALRHNRAWIYRIFDRAVDNDTRALAQRYEVPRYARFEPDGSLAADRPWPGWDGWYFFVIPDRGSESPFALLRGSVMTGTYGLDGIDNHARLAEAGLRSSEAVEHLAMIVPHANGHDDHDDHDGQAARLCQTYLPRQSALAMRRERLDVEIAERGDAAAMRDPGEAPRVHARIAGRWPRYELTLSSPELGLTAELACEVSEIVWWADGPGVFTYFAAFGRFEGSVELVHEAQGRRVITRQALRGQGAFEHGFARKPLEFSPWWAPVRWLQRRLPWFRPLHYHYELLIGDDGMRGGIMEARGFGIEIRDRGGVHVHGRYIAIERVHIRYLETEQTRGGQGTRFPTRWLVEAETAEGVLRYRASRSLPAARITDNMLYYHFSYEGELCGQAISGAGYGEYFDM